MTIKDVKRVDYHDGGVYSTCKSWRRMTKTVEASAEMEQLGECGGLNEDPKVGVEVGVDKVGVQ